MMTSLRDLLDQIDEKRNPAHHNAFVLIVSILAILGAMISSVNPEHISIAGVAVPPLCLFRLATGLDCPACGLTRAVVLAFHGAWTASYLMHLWGIPVAFILIGQIPYRIFRIAGGSSPRFSPRIRTWTVRIVLLSLLVPWVVKTAARFL